MSEGKFPKTWERVWSSILDRYYLRSECKGWVIIPVGNGNAEVRGHGVPHQTLPMALLRQDLMVQVDLEYKPALSAVRRTMIALLREIHPKDIVATYLDGEPPVTAEKMIELAEGGGDGSEKARAFFSDLLRVSRDLLVRKARRNYTYSEGEKTDD